jgi:hypothetical protein
MSDIEIERLKQEIERLKQYEPKQPLIKEKRPYKYLSSLTEEEKKQRIKEQQKASYEKRREHLCRYQKEYYRKTHIPLIKQLNIEA